MVNTYFLTDEEKRSIEKINELVLVKELKMGIDYEATINNYFDNILVEDIKSSVKLFIKEDKKGK